MNLGSASRFGAENCFEDLHDARDPNSGRPGLAQTQEVSSENPYHNLSIRNV